MKSVVSGLLVSLIGVQLVACSGQASDGPTGAAAGTKSIAPAETGGGTSSAGAGGAASAGAPNGGASSGGASSGGGASGGASSAGAAGAASAKFCGAEAGNTCSAQEYCAYSVGAACGAADAEALCQPRPDACSDIYSPVCGCDGKTYSSECDAASQGQGVNTAGACP